MTTIGQIINLALRDAGILAAGETADAETAADALATCKQMLGQWQTSKLYVTGQHQISFPANGSQTYTIGPGATIDVPLPVAVDGAFWRLNNADYPINVLSSFEDYETIRLKTIPNSFPNVIFYQRNYPNGILNVWPQPSSGTIFLIVRDVLPTYSGLSNDVAVPDEYQLAIRYSLAELLLIAFGMQPRADIATKATSARKVLKRLNLNIPLMGMPAAVSKDGGGSAMYRFTTGQ